MATATHRLHAPREAEIRQALKGWIAARRPGTAIVDELAIKHGKFRVDVCAIADDLHGYEIKSDQDTLSRLPAQAKHFSLVFHQMTLVVGPGLLGGALAIVPPWWGIVLVTVDDDGRTRFAELRDPQPNPKPNYRWVVRLLWREELAACLRAARVRGYSTLRYHQVANLMLDAFTPEQLTERVVAALRTRKGGMPALPPAPIPRPPSANPKPRAQDPEPIRPKSAPPDPSLQWLIMGLG